LSKPENTIRTSLKRLIRKGIISITCFKNGRSGWSQYVINEPIRSEIFSNIPNKPLFFTPLEHHETGGNEEKLGTKLGTGPTCSSSGINTTTNKIQVTGWDEIDISPLEEIGFTDHHLRQIQMFGNLPPEIVQDSIYHLHFDLTHNRREFRNGPLNAFMGVLRSGIPYSQPDNYAGEREKKIRKHLGDRRREQERLDEMEKELKNLEFQKWVAGLDRESLSEVLDSPPGAIPERMRSRCCGLILRLKYGQLNGLRVWWKIEKPRSKFIFYLFS
jgi:hypothetical protein